MLNTIKDFISFDLFAAPTRSVEIHLRNAKGETLYNQTIIAPKDWSDQAIGITASKYLAIKDKNNIINMIHRVVYAVATDNTGKTDKNWYNTLAGMIYYQLFSFNSPVWFNLGIDKHPQLSACFINPVEDSMDGILELGVIEGNIFKHGSGTGTNFSTLRGSMEPLSGGGIASGPLPFMKGFDYFAGAVKSGGKTRRAAKIAILDDDHPDIEAFINIKPEEEKKAQALIAAGYSANFADENGAYSTVAFQSTNLSVGISDEFMNAVKNDSDWNLINRTDGNVCKTVKAKSILMQIAVAAWLCGDPGLIFLDTINKKMPAGLKCRSSNPCGEYLFIDGSACNLGSLNLKKLYPLSNDVREAVIKMAAQSLDRIIDLSSYPTKLIETNSKKYRPIGLGIANVGGLLMSLCIPYDSNAGRNLIGNLMFTINEIAKNTCPNSYHHTCIAPTGTIGFMMDCDTTGIEPDYALQKYKTQIDGQVTLIENKSLLEGLRTHIGDNIIAQRFADEIKETGKIPIRPHYAKHLTIDYDLLEKAFACANDISPEGHMKMMAAVQPYLSGGISKTVNLPNNATAQDVYDTYIKAYDMKLKSITVYRDGSKGSQPLNIKSKIETKPIKEKTTSVRRKLPNERNSITHKFNIAGHKGYITVGLYEDGSPGELFIIMNKQGSTISGLLDGFAVLVSLGLQHGVPIEQLIEKFEQTRFDPAGTTMNPNIRFSTSIFDYVFRWLKLKFCTAEKNDSEDQKNEEPIINITSNKETVLCLECGYLMIPNGRCHKCPNCGSTSGCS